MRIVVSACAVMVTVGMAAAAQEKLGLIVPVARTSVTDYQVDEVRLRRRDWTIRVELAPNATATAAPGITCEWVLTTLRCNNGFSKTPAPAGFANAEAMVKALNKANLSLISLEKRTYNQLIADGAFVGTVSGVPD